jgi:quinol monooxygenase YgiN
MISFTVRMRFEEADHNAVAEMLRKLTLASRQEAGCVNYVAHFDQGDPSTVLIYEQYADQAALDFHAATSHFQQYATDGFYKLMLAQQIEQLDAIV